MKNIIVLNDKNRIIKEYSDDRSIRLPFYYMYGDEEEYELVKSILLDSSYRLALLHRGSLKKDVRAICNLKLRREYEIRES